MVEGAHDDGVCVAGGGLLLAVQAQRVASQCGRESVEGRRTIELRVGTREREARVVVGAGGQLPLARLGLGHVVLLGPATQQVVIDFLGDFADEALVLRVFLPVDELERVEHDEGAANLLGGQATIDRREGVRQRVQDVLLANVGDELVDVLAQSLQLVVLGLGDPVGQHMHDGAVLGKAGGDFLGDEDMRAVVRDLETTLDVVVIGDRHHRHAALEQALVRVLRLGVRLVDREELERGRFEDSRVLGVHVEVDSLDVGSHGSPGLSVARYPGLDACFRHDFGQIA